MSRGRTDELDTLHYVTANGNPSEEVPILDMKHQKNSIQVTAHKALEGRLFQI